jgi:hypothetical protein
MDISKQHDTWSHNVRKTPMTIQNERQVVYVATKGVKCYNLQAVSHDTATVYKV